MYLNVADGIVLAEALRYGIAKINSRRFLRKGFSYQITDNREALVPFSTYQNGLVMSGMTSYQTTSYFTSNWRATAPMVNVLSSSRGFDHRNVSSSKLMYDSEEVHKNLFRVIPSDELESVAIFDVLKRLGWTFVSFVSSNDQRTQQAVERFISYAGRRGVCVGTTIWISMRPNDNEYKGIISRLMKKNSPKVVVLFTTSNEAFGLLSAAKNSDGITFVAWTGLRASTVEAKFDRKAAEGLILLQIPNTYDEDFKKHFLSLTLNTNRYSWFAEYWSMVFNCSIPYGLKLLQGSFYDRRPYCRGDEKLTDDKVDLRYANVKPLLGALETIACAIKMSENQSNCDLRYRSCKLKITGGAVEYFGRQKCQLNNSLVLNDRGFYGNSFKVLNFNGSRYNEVGFWTFDESSKESSLNLSIDEITWKGGKPQFSQCYRGCSVGSIEDRGDRGDVCCYTCGKCADNQIVVNNTCTSCKRFQVPDPMRSKCLTLPTVDITTQNLPVSILKTFSAFGLVANTFVVVAFIKYRDCKMVKATGRELSVFILVTLFLSFAFPLVFIVKPTVLVCGVQRFILSLSMSVCYTPLMLKTSRIYRIFKASKTLVFKPTMVSTRSQFFICAGLIAVQVLLDVVWVVSDRPEVHFERTRSEEAVAMVCKYDPLNAVLNLLPCFILMAACTFFGYKTRNFPSNFNEAFSISITMYVSCFLWAIYVPLLFLFDYKRDNVFVSSFTTAFFMVILGLVTLLGVFGSIMYKLFAGRQAAAQTSQFFYSENTPSSASVVLGNRLAADTPQMRRPTLLSSVSQRDVGTDPILHDDCAKQPVPGKTCDKDSSSSQRDAGTDPMEDFSYQFFLEKPLGGGRKRLGSV